MIDGVTKLETDEGLTRSAYSSAERVSSPGPESSQMLYLDELIVELDLEASEILNDA